MHTSTMNPARAPSKLALTLVGALLLATVGVALYVLVVIWPSVVQVPAKTGGQAPGTASPTLSVISSTHLFGWSWNNPSPDSLYLVAVAVLGVIGASVAALTSFATFVGNRSFMKSWNWWYVMRLPIGAALAVIFYFVLRGGLLTVSTTTGAISPYGIGAVAALAGMFSKQATDKLDEVFTTLFQTKKGGDSSRRDNVDGTQPSQPTESGST